MAVLAVSEVALVCAAGVVMFEVFVSVDACEYGYGVYANYYCT